MNGPSRLQTIAAYALLFVGFIVVVGRVLHARGRIFLSHTFGAHPDIARSVQFLLDLGFYLTCGALLLLNLGIPVEGAYNNGYSWLEAVQTVAIRLGVSVFVVAMFHTANILILSILNRRNRTDAG